jgi:hypothetical protein
MSESGDVLGADLNGSEKRPKNDYWELRRLVFLRQESQRASEIVSSFGAAPVKFISIACRFRLRSRIQGGAGVNAEIKYHYATLWFVEMEAGRIAKVGGDVVDSLEKARELIKEWPQRCGRMPIKAQIQRQEIVEWESIEEYAFEVIKKRIGS